MAHDPKLKAKVLTEWASGKYTEEQLSKRHKIAESTIGDWIRPKKRTGAKRVAKPVQSNPKVDRYLAALERFGVATMEMLTSQAELLTDKDYIRNKNTDDIRAHTRDIRDSLERFIRIHQPIQQASSGHDALPGRAETDVVVPELVEEGSSS